MPRIPMPMPSQWFVERMIDRRVKAGLNKAAVARALNVDRSLITHFEKRRRPLNPEFIERLASLYSGYSKESLEAQTYAYMLLKEAGYRRFPGFLQLLEVSAEKEHEFVELMREADPSQREELVGFLTYLRLKRRVKAADEAGVP